VYEILERWSCNPDNMFRQIVKVVEFSSLKKFKKCVDVALRDVV